jgi:chemotaxis protein MotB
MSIINFPDKGDNKGDNKGDKKSGDDYDDFVDDIIINTPSSHDDDFHAKKPEEGEGPWLISYADLMTLLMGFFALIASFSTPDVKKFEEVKKSAAERFQGEYKEPYKELEGQVKEALKQQIAEGKVKVTRASDGVSIKFEGKSLFNSGEFVVQPEGAETVHAITKTIQSEIGKFKVVVEGHTDNVPITHPIIASNWELSAIRAARIAQLMVTDGFKNEQVTIQGWGDTKPEVPNTDESGVAIPANQAANRRVILKISE